MGSRWKQSPRARQWVERQKNATSWGEVIGGLLGIAVIYLILRGIFFLLHAIWCSAFVCSVNY